ncbi:hypothetical protein MJ391_10455 [Escherichia coli]|nr:hypothetical protein MJ391_10455 [Escherichia coli]
MNEAQLRNSQYGAMKVKDTRSSTAFTRKNLPRPIILIAMRRISALTSGCIKKPRSIALDLSGDGLHLRGYRDRAGMTRADQRKPRGSPLL